MPEPSVAFPYRNPTFERPIDPREKIPVILRHFLKACGTYFRLNEVTVAVTTSGARRTSPQRQIIELINWEDGNFLE